MERNGKPGETVSRDRGGAFQYSRRGLRLRRRGAYGIHRASGPRCQGLCRKVASLRSGGRRLAVRIAMEHPIGVLPRTPFPASRDFPSRGNERYEGKTGSHTLHVPFRSFPLWWLAPPPCPHFVVALWVLSNGIMSLQESIECFILLPLAGEVPRSGKEGGERSEPITECLSCHMT